MIKIAYAMAHPSDERLPLPAESTWTSAQAEAAAELIAGPRGAVIGPFKPLLYSPDLMGRVQRTGEYLRFNTELRPALTELAILIVSKHWGQPVEWNIHRPLALKSGVQQADIDALEAGAPPPSLDHEQQIVYDFYSELQAHHAVGDAVYARALEAFGARGVIDLTALAGYYTLLAMVMNVARTPG